MKSIKNSQYLEMIDQSMKQLSEGKEQIHELIEVNLDDENSTNDTAYALKTLQVAMEGEAEKTGLTTEDDIVNLCREVRAEVEGL